MVAVSQRADAAWLDAAVAAADVVLDCSDNFATRHAVNAACVAHARPLVSGAAIGFDVADPAAAKANAFVIHHDLHRITDVFKIIQRLAHAHQHHIRHKAHFGLGLAFDRPFAQIIARQHDLADNLCRRQIAHQLLRAGVAKAAR